MYKHFKIITMSLLAAACLLPATAMAADCTVISSADSGEGTLREKLLPANNCKTIKFSTPEFVITVKTPLYLIGSKVTITGPVNIAASSQLLAALPPLYVTGKSNTITSVGLSHSAGVCLIVKGYNNKIINSSFNDCMTGIQVHSGKYNSLLQNTFENIEGEEVALINGGNISIPSAANMDAVMNAPDSFVLTGEVFEGTESVQIYKKENGEDGSKNAFPVSLTTDIYSIMEDLPVPSQYSGDKEVFAWTYVAQDNSISPLSTFAVLATDKSGNTSAFSEAVIPLALSSFFNNYPVCGEAEWFTDPVEGYWFGDYDGDGMTNGAEDMDRDCVIEGEGESDPSKADSDADGYNNDSDNCPYVSNPDQTDTDGEGLGDICDDDDDGDGIADTADNCPFMANPDQTDSNNNGLGVACDASENVSTPPSDAPPPDFLEGEEEPEDEDEASGDSGGCSLIR